MIIKFEGGPSLDTPRFTLSDALAVVHRLSLLLAAEAQSPDGLPHALLTPTMRALVGAAEALAAEHGLLFATRDALPSSPAPSQPHAELRAAYALPWRLVRSQVTVWVGMTRKPDTRLLEVQACLDDDGGMNFLRRGTPDSTWVAGDSKLKKLRALDAASVFRSRDMEALVTNLERAHTHYASALSEATARKGQVAQLAPQRATRARVDTLLMHYVLQVCATASVDDAASVRRAEHMLLPYRDAVALVAARRAEARARRKATVPVHTAPANESTSPATQAATGT